MADRILITGASGFIGKYLVDEALRCGFEVYAAMRATSKRDGLTDPGIHFFPFDLWKPDVLFQDLKQFADETGGFDYVIHNAAVNKPNDFNEFITGNAEFTREFARMLLETQPDLKKFVFMSSMAAIGPGDSGTMEPIHEKHTRHPVTPYGHSKLLAERYLHEIDTLPYIILRPTGVYGAGDEKFALRVISLMKKGIEVTLGHAEQQVSFVHARDVANLSLLSCSLDVRREDFNISDGRFYRQRDFTRHLREIMNVRTIRLRVPAKVLTATGYVTFRTGRFLKRPVHLSHKKMLELTAKNWKVDISKAREMLGYEPMFELRDGLEDVVKSIK